MELRAVGFAILETTVWEDVRSERRNHIRNFVFSLLGQSERVSIGLRRVHFAAEPRLGASPVAVDRAGRDTHD